VATIPGAWAGDALDNLYNVGGPGQWSDGSETWHSGLTYPGDYTNKNQMVIGLANGYAYNGANTWDSKVWGSPGSSTDPTGFNAQVSVDYSCSAELRAPDGSIIPVPIQGLVFADEGGYPCARVFNIGDSRTYHVSGRAFTQVTRDHSEVQELLDAGIITEEQSLTWERRNVITRALGGYSGPVVGADVHLVPLNAGDRFLLCSDGLSGVVSDTEIGEVARYMEDSNETAQTLVQKALGAGGSDNVTVLVVDIVDCSPRWPALEVEGETATCDRRNVGDDTVPRKGD